MTSEVVVSGLRDHLRSLDEQDHAKKMGPSFPLYFESSLACCRSPFFSCRSSRCALIQFVPEELRGEPAPCRHIQLNERGETLQVLYGHGERQKTEAAVRSWLISTIASFDSEVRDSEMAA